MKPVLSGKYGGHICNPGTRAEVGISSIQGQAELQQDPVSKSTIYFYDNVFHFQNFQLVLFQVAEISKYLQTF